jgi:branched-chain amino acid transport system permease protein
VVAVALVGTTTSDSLQLQFRSVLVTASIVVALHVFIGNSGVISFGQVSFVAIGAFGAGVATTPVDVKPFAFPELFPFLKELELSNIESLLLAAVLGGVYALVVGVPLMRLSGLSAGIATFAVIIITNNVFRNWERIGPGAKTLTQIPETTSFLQATVGLLIVIAVAYAYQRTRQARMLRAAREDPPAAQSSGVDIYRQRLLAFTLSGALAGFAGGLLVHLAGTLTTEQVFLDLTFITLAMLVVGGIGSLWGSVLGALFIAGLNAYLTEAERGVRAFGVDVDLPSGTRLIALGAIMALVLLFRPSGLTGGRELTWPFVRRARATPGG